jgi:mannose-6-phosphate isomerase-like protein (cupin superfamily)
MTLLFPATERAQPVRPPQFFEFSGELLEAESAGVLSPGWRFTGEHSWLYRAQNFVVDVSWIAEGGSSESGDLPDEHALLVPRNTSVEVSAGAETLTVQGPAFVVVPPGESRVLGREAGFVVRVYSSRASELVARAHNGASYDVANFAVAALPPVNSLGVSKAIRVHPVSDIETEPGRFGRIYRTSSLLVNWFEPEEGPRDTDHLTPHSHEDFEQASVTLEGDYVHHVRQPWTERLRDWRSDEHVQISSPSVTIIPPGNIHTTRAVGEGTHQLIDVFAPPRQDFIDRGWVLNQSDYADQS